MPDIQLQYALRDSSLHALLLSVSKALSRSGYGDVQFLDRRLPRQKSRFGGHELVCETVIGPRSMRVIVKVLRDSVRIRHLDELAGAVTRMGADSGLIISPFGVTKTAARLLDSYGPIRVGVIDGESLAKWLRELGIGVRRDGSVDWAYFGNIEEMSNRVLSFIATVAG